jgi:preprotein translocase subunit SecE
MKLFNYIKDVKGEMKHVSWPSKKQTTTYTILVIVISVILAYFLGLFDYIFSSVIKNLF